MSQPLTAENPQRTMHIAHCLTHSELGGGQSAVYTLVRQLLRLHTDIRISVCLPADGIFAGRFQQLGVDVHPVPFDHLSFSSYRTSCRSLRAIGPDIVHSHGKGAGLFARLPSPSRFSSRHIHSYHGFHPPHRLALRMAYLLLERWLLQRTDAVVSVSQSEGDEVRRCFPHCAGRIEVIQNAVDGASLRQAAQERLPDEVDGFVTQNGQRRIITMIAREDPVKDYPLALSTAGKVLRREPASAFAFVGISEAHPQAGLLRKEFGERIFCIATLANPAPLILCSHATMLTSRKEGGLPLVLQESLCLQKPVVATDVPGTREVVHDGINGLLVRQDSDLLAEALCRILRDVVLYRALADGAKHAVAARTVETMCAKYHTLYRRVMQES